MKRRGFLGLFAAAPVLAKVMPEVVPQILDTPLPPMPGLDYVTSQVPNVDLLCSPSPWVFSTSLPRVLDCNPSDMAINGRDHVKSAWRRKLSRQKRPSVSI